MGQLEIVALAEGMRQYNQETQRQVGFYGLDVYSLWESMNAVIGYLEKKRSGGGSARKAGHRCFEPFGGLELVTHLYREFQAFLVVSCSHVPISLVPGQLAQAM